MSQRGDGVQTVTGPHPSESTEGTGCPTHAPARAEQGACTPPSPGREKAPDLLRAELATSSPRW